MLCLAWIKPGEADKAPEVKALKIRMEKKRFDWPREVGIQDLQTIADLSDFHLVFPFDAWMRRACKDAMAAKIGQSLLVRCLKLFLIDYELIKVKNRSEVFKETKQFLLDDILKDKDKLD